MVDTFMEHLNKIDKIWAECFRELDFLWEDFRGNKRNLSVTLQKQQILFNIATDATAEANAKFFSLKKPSDQLRMYLHG